MNIFALSSCPVRAAQYQCDKHVVKMILESAQLLSSAHHMTESKYAPLVYKLTHKNHPCSIWTRTSRQNYDWVSRHFVALSEEYFYRYGRIHKSYSLYNEILSNCPSLPDIGLTEFVKCVPDEYKCYEPVTAYRHLYYFEKRKTIKMVWTEREKPDWWLRFEALDELTALSQEMGMYE